MKYILFLSLVLISCGFQNARAMGARAPQAANDFACQQPGWFPDDFGLKDHHVFWFAGYYYLVSTYVPSGNPLLTQDRFAYARSTDLCTWERLSYLLVERTPGSWDETAIWAPFVYVESGIYYLYYTGVTRHTTQSILLATSSNPADPASWQKHSMVFQPSHPGSLWVDGQYADCRDPFLLKQGDQYYLYYTGTDESGGVIGVATATSPSGPWTDWGSIITPLPGKILESPALVTYDQAFYLFYNDPQIGEFYQIGATPVGPWLAPAAFQPGWAHEIWLSPADEWFTSYLTNYSVSINRLLWENNISIPQPSIDWVRARIYLPLINH